MNNELLETVQMMMNVILEENGVENDVDIRDLIAIKEDEESPEMQSFIDRYIMINMGGKVVIVDKHDISNQFSYEGFLRFYSHITEKVKVIDKVNSTEEEIAYKVVEKPVANKFLEKKIERFEKIVFKPSNSLSPGEFNYFKGWAYEKKDGLDKCSGYLNHIFENICSNDQELYEYVLDWMAQLVQFPEKKLDKALVLRGKPGTGKGFFVQEFGCLLGEAFHHLTSILPLINNFNGELANRLLVFADEITWGGKRAEGARLKTFISEDRINIEYKGKDVITMNNFARLIISSNHEWIVPVEGGDRRYVVIDVNDNVKENKKYFSNIHYEMITGGREQLFNLLSERDISKRDWSIIPYTSARDDQKLLSLEPHELWMFESLNGGLGFDYFPWGIKGFNQEILNSSIYESYSKYMGDFHKNQYLKSSREISTYITKIIGGKAIKKNGHVYRVFPSDMKDRFIEYHKLDDSVWDI